MASRTRTHIVAALAVIALVVPAGCSWEKGFQGAEPEPDEVRLVQQPWEDLVVENEIVRQVLGELGYRTRVQELSVPLGAQALANDQADAYLGNWWPSQESVFERHLATEKVDVAGTIVTGSEYAPAVPEAVAEKYGVRSLADLDEKGDLFDRQILGIEPGSPGNDYIANAIEADAYGLGDWQLVQSSTAAMLSEVERRVDEGKPIVFLGWKPHWMNLEWDLHYLDDPERVWPGAGGIRTVFSEDFAAREPDIARFLSQIRVDQGTASTWIHQLSKEQIPKEKIAADWIRANPDEVRSWLRGVRAADGGPAAG
ncbi:ABC transporter substrate-binding protein [Saccharopolyspora sp. HNM0983]|uniref:ABC transporter substrate-binding protein n=1 Tax=Saccharopolyspora montiporae TaxID=2781240 RepID=A0A929FY17_9PSEU|nr:ABC transporter substrate-binding protein [Saccharopolyspora sp. HNM0983]MBE9375261.1 ABC transporter substrate-binding protein [Saccharopolyspora sp. HNM0983]